MYLLSAPAALTEQTPSRLPIGNGGLMLSPCERQGATKIRSLFGVGI
jgi:hypothetical protein